LSNETRIECIHVGNEIIELVRENSIHVKICRIRLVHVILEALQQNPVFLTRENSIHVKICRIRLVHVILVALQQNPVFLTRL
jgi:hypothetical protein